MGKHEAPTISFVLIACFFLLMGCAAHVLPISSTLPVAVVTQPSTGAESAPASSPTVPPLASPTNTTIPTPTLTPEPLPSNVVFSPDGKTLITVADSGEVNLWNAQTLKAEQTIKAGKIPFRRVFLSPEGSLLACGAEDQMVLLDPASGQMLVDLTGHTMQVNSLAFSPNGTVLASVGEDGTVRLWGIKE